MTWINVVAYYIKLKDLVLRPENILPTRLDNKLRKYLTKPELKGRVRTKTMKISFFIFRHVCLSKTFLSQISQILDLAES